MQQIWTNPSVERSFISLHISKSELLNYLKLTATQENSRSNKEILVFPNMEYQFTFYDADYGTRRSITALVTKVYEDQIKVKYVPSKNTDKLHCKECRKTDCPKKYEPIQEGPMPTCNCILNPADLSFYEEPVTYFIPIANLINAAYVKNPTPPKPKEKGDVKVMLLGISATMVKAIIIRLGFFDDSIQDAVKYVELKVGGVYDIAYEAPDGTIYESRAKVVKIEEADDIKSAKPGKGFVRENVGMDGAIYTACAKDKFMKDPPAPMVRIIVDTSENFSGRFETIYLHTIRDCTCVEEGEIIIPDNKPSDNGCCCESTYKYNYDNMSATITGDNVDLIICGKPQTVSLESLVKYYLGVEE